MPTKAKTKKSTNRKISAVEAEKTDEQAEAKRQSVHVPVSNASETEGSHSIDHGTIRDSEVLPDTNLEAQEDIDQRNQNDLSFWSNSWAWTKADRAYGDKPEDKWFVNPTPKLIGEVMQNVPTVFEACRVALSVGNQQEQMNQEKERHLDFLRGAESAELVSECLDMLTAYQSRFFESVQRWIGLAASYENQVNNDNAKADDVANAAMKKKTQGDICRGWAARLLALTEAYHEVVTDERAYNLTFDFAPKPGTSQANLFKWSITTAMNKIGRRLARSIKQGNLDAEKYRIPRPWLEEGAKSTQISADQMISDFD